MALPLALLAVGAGMQIYQQYTGNMAQAQAELQNARFYDMQSQFAREAMSRESLISRRKYATTIGAQIGAFAKGGVSTTKGSSIGVIANTLAQQVDELDAIKKKGFMEFTLAAGRASQARDVAGTLGSAGYNVLQAGTTALTAYARTK